jgi:hypothetical protein
MSSPSRLLLLMGGLTAAGLACSGSPHQPAFEVCPGDMVTVSVGPGTTPSFTWTPACGVGFLEVFPAPSDPAAWTVYAAPGSGENPIPSGVQYGVTPLEGQTVAGPEALAAGTSYRVRVARLICDQGVLCTLQDAGAATFQP